MASNSTDPVATHGSQLPVLLGVIIPLLLLLIVVILALSAILLWLAVRQRRKKYNPLSTKDDRLPYPPLVQLDQPPNPHMTYTLAANLDPCGMVEGRATSPLLPRNRGRAVSPLRGSPPEAPRTEAPLRLSRRRPGAIALRRHTLSNEREASQTPDNLTPERTPERAVTPDSSDTPVESGYPPNLRMYLLSAKVQKTNTATNGHKLPEIHFVLRYDDQPSSLVVRVEKVTHLPLRDDGSEVNAFVRMYFTPMQHVNRGTARTEMVRKASDPVFDEEITYEAMSKEDMDNSTLHLEVVDYQAYGKQKIIGRNQLALRRVTYTNGEARIHLSLPPPLRFGEYCGVILLSLCYDPLGKKLSIIILRAKDLNKGKCDQTDVHAKVTVYHRGSVLCKLKTKKKQGSCSPIFNEALSCVVDQSKLKDVKVEISLLNDSSKAKRKEMGCLILGPQTGSEQLRHWNDMLASPGKHLSEWHELHSF